MNKTFTLNDWLKLGEWLEPGKNDTITIMEETDMTNITEEQAEALREIETFWRTTIAEAIMAAAPAVADLPATRETFQQCANIALGDLHEPNE